MWTHPRPMRHALAALAIAAAIPASAFDLQGHRGARGLAPENTLAAFAAAQAVGVDTLELDTVLTADEVVVVSHDSRLNPALTRDTAGRWIEAPGPTIRSLDLATLQRYDVGRLQPGTRYAESFAAQRPSDGARIPTLAEVFEQVRRSGDTALRFNIETKLSPLDPASTPEPEPFVRAVLAVVDAHGMRERVMLQSFDWRSLAVARRLAPDVPTACLSAQQSWGNNVADPRWTGGLVRDDFDSLPAMVQAAGCAVWSPYFGDLDGAALARAHALGLRVIVWTVNEPAAIEQMLALGVDGLISDRPDRVREAMARRGMALPARTPR